MNEEETPTVQWNLFHRNRKLQKSSIIKYPYTHKISRQKLTCRLIADFPFSDLKILRQTNVDRILMQAIIKLYEKVLFVDGKFGPHSLRKRSVFRTKNGLCNKIRIIFQSIWL